MEPHAVSRETPSWWEWELSDYCCRQWLVSVWGRREKKREGERAREGGREAGRQGVKEGGRGRLLLLFEKAEKSLRALSQEGLGSGGDAGKSCLTPAPRVSLARRLHWDNQTTDLSAGLHQALLTHPKGLCSSAPPPLPPLFLLSSFSPGQKKKIKNPSPCALSSHFWISLWTSRGVNKGFKSLAHAGNGEV